MIRKSLEGAVVESDSFRIYARAAESTISIVYENARTLAIDKMDLPELIEALQLVVGKGEE